MFHQGQPQLNIAPRQPIMQTTISPSRMKKFLNSMFWSHPNLIEELASNTTQTWKVNSRNGRRRGSPTKFLALLWSHGTKYFHTCKIISGSQNKKHYFDSFQTFFIASQRRAASNSRNDFWTSNRVLSTERGGQQSLEVWDIRIHQDIS